ncbi:ATP-NAD kinase family protein [Candidatus Bathyarchaeota archaeon]|nr:ATP-NAD kinase family protein [Candidatus Bathyarchaeota archaeon]
MGFIVNPIAGMGGRVGLKGTDGVLEEAVARGAKPVSPKRAVEFLRELKESAHGNIIKIITCPGVMGEVEAKEAEVAVEILPMKIGVKTTAEDTKRAVELLADAKTDLIVFVGGDGTAKDILNAIKEKGVELPVLGIPSGVKMYSGVFAVNPSDAVEVVLAYARGEAEITEFEVMDADETAIRSDTFAVRLYGFLKGPFLPMKIQGSKQVSPETVDEKENQMAIAKSIVEEMQPSATYILGPGTTVKCIAELLGVPKTVLGVDIYKNGKIILDVDEKKILENVEDWQNTWIILSPIGRQGILLGRGNQQISPEIIKRVGKNKIIVAATKSKLRDIEGGILRVDTGDAETDKMLRGYIKVVTDYREWCLMPVQ